MNPVTSKMDERQEWSSLPKLPLFMIASQLDAIAHACFRSACSSWHFSSPARPKLPLLILTERNTIGRPTSIRFFEMDANQIINFPKSSLEFGSHFCGSSHGWLAFLDPASKIYLLNPFKPKLLINLPKHTALYRKDKALKGIHFPVKLALSAVPTDPCCIFAAISVTRNQVDFCSPGNNILAWKTLVSHDKQYAFQDILFYKGHFYVGFNRTLCRVDITANDGKGELIVVPLEYSPVDSDGSDSEDVAPSRTYLVDFSGDLVLVHMHNNGSTYYEFLRVDFENKRFEMVDLGVDELMFLGHSRGICSSANRFRHCRQDSVFLTKLLVNECLEPDVFCAEDSARDLRRQLFDHWPSVHQWEALGWLTPSLLE